MRPDQVNSANASHKEHKIFIYDALIIINHGMCYCNWFAVAFIWTDLLYICFERQTVRACGDK